MENKKTKDSNLHNTLEKVKTSIEIAGAPATAIAAVWGYDIAGYVAATATFAISLITYIEYFLKK
ncbi:hypothetical protein FACS1894195_0040 [Bacteroidia bacterium]|nr:hypothetical protein FACS1894195_0040 [Bacteroidia bacterium]